MIDKRVNVAKRLKDYKELLEAYKKAADIKSTNLEIRAYYEGKFEAYRTALSLFEEFVEKVLIKKERRIRK